MVSPHAWLIGACRAQLLPSERRFVNIETPDVIDRFRARVTTEYEQVRLAEYYCVAVPPAWRSPNDRDYHPLGRSVTISQIEQVEIVGCQASTY